MTGCVWWGKGCRGAGFPAPWKPDGVPSKLDGVLSGVDGVPWRLDGVHSEVGGVHSKLDGVPSNVDGAHSKADGTPWKSDGVPWTVDGVPCGMERSRPQKSRRRGTAAGKCWKKPGTVPLPEPWSRGAVELMKLAANIGCVLYKNVGYAMIISSSFSRFHGALG